MTTSLDIVETATIMTIYTALFIAQYRLGSQILSLTSFAKNVDFSAS
jgi:hypothetical protein